jgi:6,7-dimethyl-8-ribityllumazine synthase
MSEEPPHLLIVEARFYEDISDALFAGAKAELEKARATFDRITVPGALEIPGAIAMAHEACTKFSEDHGCDGFIALGCVIRGETSHYDIVAGESARGLMQLTIDKSLAIGNGILTVEDEDQAWERADPTRLNKGGGAAAAVLRMIEIKRRFGLVKA